MIICNVIFKKNNRMFHNTKNRFIREFINTFKKSYLKYVAGMIALSYDFVYSFHISSKKVEIKTEIIVFTH